MRPKTPPPGPKEYNEEPKRWMTKGTVHAGGKTPTTPPPTPSPVAQDFRMSAAELNLLLRLLNKYDHTYGEQIIDFIQHVAMRRNMRQMFEDGEAEER